MPSSPMLDLSALRENYTKGNLDVSSVLSNPIDQFRIWFQEATASQVPEPNAMHLATVSASGQPSGRIVLLKTVDEQGFVWYTNYESKKGHELADHPQAALTFFWVELERQVRIEGKVEKVTEEDSDAYFAVRPRSSQIGAWSSPQSQVITNRETLEENEKRFQEQFLNQPVPRPAHWGGYRLIPQRMEFWQGRPSRLHDRLLYTFTDNQWQIERLAP
ncbi:pyridoxamine 5'-phosphate oxidase [Siphonobacter sp. SORGH_AS_0500]|uniref:pyridoxamine 5'-phosphate oxidase n=1 Tax=Siphonobacter sp. SORGH_AS_0500 TaxID=1864824 RepID=UPI0018E30254|nr:pyridoxamine 5'-phosphate oxidase [Siphonobacter sp. SORGH_AS_0500]